MNIAITDLPVEEEADDFNFDLKLPPLAEGTQDWQLLCTDGHVLGHRVVAVIRGYTIPALLCGLLGGFFAFQSLTGWGSGYRLPADVISSLTYDPGTFVSAPAVTDRGLDYRLGWLANLKPERGLDDKGWGDLVRAASADLTAHGDKTDDYAAVPRLASAPTVTRPAKAISDHTGDLASGVIAIPASVPGRTPEATHVLAWVGGKLAWAVMAPGRAPGIIFGPVPPGMQQVPPYAAPPELLNQLKPGA